LADEKSERYKPLQNLYKTFPDHNSKNTLIVDDRIDVCRLNCMNALVVREYDYIPSQYDGYVNDTHLFSLAQFFRRPDVREAQDVHLILHKWQSEV